MERPRVYSIPAEVLEALECQLLCLYDDDHCHEILLGLEKYHFTRGREWMMANLDQIRTEIHRFNEQRGTATLASA
jgi:hypothetical protein